MDKRIVALVFVVFLLLGWIADVVGECIKSKKGGNFGWTVCLKIIAFRTSKAIAFLYIVQIQICFLAIVFLAFPYLLDALSAVMTPENEVFIRWLPIAFLVNSIVIAAWGVNRVIEKFI